MGRIALCALLCLALCAPALAEETPAPHALSGFVAEGYPVPDVPECDRVDDGYFAGAVLVGDSTAASFELLGVVPELTTIWETGLSPRTAESDHIFEVDNRYVTLSEKLESMQPTKVYLWLGSNGVDTKAAKLVLEDYDRLLNALIPRLPHTLIYLVSLTPVKLVAQEQYANYTNERVDEFNDYTYIYSAAHNVYYLHVNHLLRNEKGLLDGEYGAGDGIHLRASAYDLLSAYLYTHAIPDGQEEYP